MTVGVALLPPRLHRNEFHLGAWLSMASTIRPGRGICMPLGHRASPWVARYVEFGSTPGIARTEAVMIASAFLSSSAHHHDRPPPPNEAFVDQVDRLSGAEGVLRGRAPVTGDRPGIQNGSMISRIWSMPFRRAAISLGRTSRRLSAFLGRDSLRG